MLSGKSTVPLAPIGTLDDLLARAQRGAQATAALDLVKEKLTALRDDVYYKLLNAPPEKLSELRAELKALEKLARALLVDEAQGELAYRALMETRGGPPEAEAAERPILKPTRVPRARRPRAKDTTANAQNAQPSA